MRLIRFKHVAFWFSKFCDVSFPIYAGDLSLSLALFAVFSYLA